MDNKLYEIMNGKYNNVTIKNQLAGMFINLDTDSLMKSFIEHITTKDSMPLKLKELERRYIDH